jgi:hypothetical protein
MAIIFLLFKLEEIFSEYVYLYVNLYKISEEIFFATLISGSLAGYPVSGQKSIRPNLSKNPH